MTSEQLSRELEKGYADMLAGHCEPAEKVFKNIRRDMRHDI